MFHLKVLSDWADICSVYRERDLHSCGDIAFKKRIARQRSTKRLKFNLDLNLNGFHPKPDKQYSDGIIHTGREKETDFKGEVVKSAGW